MIYTCPKCDKELQTERGLKSHYGQVHEGSLKNTATCERCGDEYEVWPSQEDKSLQCSPCFQKHGFLEETKKKIRGKMEGRDIHWKNKISETLSGEGSYWYGVTGEDHPAYGHEPSDELRELWSEQRKGHEPYGGIECIKVEETGHKVRSSWEKEIDLLLHHSGFEYEYEPHQLSLSDGRGYLPDFVVHNRVIIEVKGWADEISKEKAKMVDNGFPEYELIVVGDNLEAGIHIPWDEKDNLLSVLTEVN